MALLEQPEDFLQLLLLRDQMLLLLDQMLLQTSLPKPPLWCEPWKAARNTRRPKHSPGRGRAGLPFGSEPPAGRWNWAKNAAERPATVLHPRQVLRSALTIVRKQK